MYKKKVKIFLGAHLNYINAQNLNCLALAKYLDPKKFSTYALSAHFSPKVKTKANLFNCFFPFRLSSPLGFLWGILKCDVAYLPKHITTPKWIFYIAHLLGKKVFTTIEINMCDIKKESLINSFGSSKNLIDYFKYVSNIFGITQHIIDHSNCGIKLDKRVLYLGVDADLFSEKLRKRLKNVVFIGSLTKRKRVNEFLQLAKQFSHLNFYIIGSGIELSFLKNNATTNVTFLGTLTQKEVSSILNKMDLHILPSKCEGFPKVILEAAAAGIPSLVYSDYGASEWIVNNNNGFIVGEYAELTKTIDRIINEADLLAKTSKGAILMAKRFNWKRIIKDWEDKILSLE